MIMKSIFKSFVIILAFYLAFILIGTGNITFFSGSFFTDLGMFAFFMYILCNVMLYYFV
ncbi:MAG: hypothetical protein HYW05_02285 [Candidatus Diapherotrites archaeon]|nr:hypothetical protein [Candidatus Diapherotrites archaeon]